MIRKGPLRVLAAVVLIALAWGAYRAIAGWWYRAELSQADREVVAGRFGPARERLVRLARIWPDEAAIPYQLGHCERAAGHPARALAAWSRIAPGSPLAMKAALARDELIRQFQDRGQFAALEELLIEGRLGTGPIAAELGQALARLWRYEGRIDEVKRLLRAEWVRAAHPAHILHELWMLDAEPVPVEMVRGVLDEAARQAPEDDRVWLGRANLAIWSGRWEEADRWLAACLDRRPHDPPVWRARLEWARAAGRIDGVEQALAHLPADWMDPEEELEVRAWSAGERGDHEAEQLALERVIEQAPGNTRALERLAALAVEAGRPDRSGELRRRKGEVDRAREGYRKLLAIDATTVNLPTAARLAEVLGRWHEAQGWWSLDLRQAPHNTEARAALDRLARRMAPRPRAATRPGGDRSPGPVVNSGASQPASSAVPPDFSEDAPAVGLRFAYNNGRTSARQLPETMGGGVGLLDYDGDGWLDVYCVQGGPFPPGAGPGTPHAANADRLFRNRGDGTFEDATQRARLPALPGGYGHGVAVGDYDNDGRPDLFVTRWRSYALSRNRGDGTFEDVTEAAGLGGDRDWPTSAAWADLDGDGDLDLYVCHYLAWDTRSPLLCRDPNSSDGSVYCDPRRFESMRDHLFRNDRGRFVDVTTEAGIVDRDGRGLGVVAADLDDDGRVDLYVANDTTANYLFRNRGGLQFDEVGVAAGVAANAHGGFQAGMGVACGDLDGDGRPDLAVTNFYGESTSLYHNLGELAFSDQTASAGLAAASRSLLGFGIAVLDFNNDGRLDLATANGHVNDFRPSIPDRMPVQLLAGVGRGRLVDASESGGRVWQVPRIGRGLAAGDLDNDGRLDLVVVAHDSPLAYFHNRTRSGQFVTLRLEGTASNRDGVGARVMVETGDGRRLVVHRVGGGSYLSAGDPRLHLGLGDSDRVETIEIVWPSGRVDRHRNLAAEAGYRLREGSTDAAPLEGFPRHRRGE